MPNPVYHLRRDCETSSVAKQFKVLSEWIKAHASALTNRISLAHLHAACKGYAVSLLHNVLNAISTNDATLLQHALTELDHYGHSSGKDALRGVLAVISTREPLIN